MPVLGNVYPVKIEILIFFVTSFLCSLEFLFDTVCPVFEIYAIELLGSMSTDEAWRQLRTLHFYPEYIDLPGVCMQKFVMINWILLYNSYGLSNIVNITIL